MAVQLPRALHPFRTGQYRILAGALVISLLGAGVWIVALVFEVKGLGGTPSDLSFVAAFNAVGLIAAALVGGVVADRVPQKRILVAVESTKVLGFAAAAVLGLSGNVEVWHLAVIAFVLGVADSFFYPAYTALLPSILDERDLLPANGIEGMLRPLLLQAAGPVLASVLIVTASPASRSRSSRCCSCSPWPVCSGCAPPRCAGTSRSTRGGIRWPRWSPTSARACDTPCAPPG